MKKRRSILAQNFLTLAAMLFLCISILGIAFASVSYQFVMRDRKADMEINADEAAKIVSAVSTEWPLDSLEVRMQIASIAETSGYHILICGMDGEVISCSDKTINCSHIGATMDYNIMRRVDNEGEYNGIGTLGGMFLRPRYTVADDIKSLITGDTVGYIFMSANNETMVQLWRQFSSMFFTVSLLAIVIAFIAAYIMGKRQAKPINAMASAANRFAKGDYSVRVNIDRDDEMGYLADAFNAMADSMEKSEKLRREFIANVSHELKTPMTTISGFTDGILDGTIPPEKQNEYLQVVSSETKRLSRMVRSMLKMSQIQDMDKTVIMQKSFDISEVMRVSILSLEQKITDKGLDVEVELPEEAMKVRGDQDGITQVVYNLIDNAVKFSDRGSTLKLELWKEGRKAFVSVENTGTEIPEDELPHIFDRFHKTDKSRNMDKDGVGLGLYIVKTILDNHNEDIFVSSEKGVTKITFTLTLI